MSLSNSGSGFRRASILRDGVDDGGVVLASEGLADLGEGGVGEGLDEVHRDLSRDGDGLGVVPGLEVRELDVVVVGDVLLDHLDRDGLLLGGEEIAEDLLGEGEVDVRPVRAGIGDQADEAALELADVGT